MKKFCSAIAIILFILSITNTIFAQDSARSGSGLTAEKMIAPLPPVDGMPASLFGQHQSYSVVFRGNGEAVVNLRLLFPNTQSSNLASLSFRIPKVEPKDMFAFQVIQPQYDDPSDPYGWYGPAKYQRAATQYAGDTVTITLPQPIKPEKFGSILLYYRAFGYAKKDVVGAYRFAFETLQAQEPVEQVDVGITTDSNLLLRGTQDRVNYRFEDVSVASKGMAEMAAPSANTRLDAYYQQIGSGQLIKSASGLAALESFTVHGSYADGALRLYAKEIVIGAAVCVIILLLAIGIFRVVIKALGTQPAASSQTATILAVIGVSFLSAVFMLGYTVVIMFIVRNLSIFMNYDASLQLPVMVVLLIISLGIYGFILFAPAMFISMKRGIMYGLATAGFTLGWLILAVIIFVIISFFSGTVQYPVLQRGLTE